MTNLIQILAIGSASVGVYIFASKQLTKYMMNGGKSPKQIIDIHTNDTNKRFLIKYPEADIKTSKHLILALSFIFVFVSSIFAFSIIGEGMKKIIIPPLIPEGTEIEYVDPFSIQKKQKQKKLEEIIKKTKSTVITITKEEIIPPDINDGIEVSDSFDSDFDNGGEIIGYDPIIIEVQPVFQAENMPRFNECETENELEARACTELGIQRYIGKMDIPNMIEDGGKVYIEFVVGKRGRVQDVLVKRGVNKQLDNVVLKHMKKMPKFANGGKQNGMPVKVKYIVPVNIIIE